MKSINLPIILNTTITFLISFFIGLIIVSAISVKLWLKILLVLPIALCVTALVYLSLKNASRTKSAKTISAKKINYAKNYLLTLKQKQLSDLLGLLFLKLNKPVMQLGQYFLIDGITIIFAIFKDPITPNEISYLLNSSPFNTEKTYIIANDCTTSSQVFSKAINTTIVKTDLIVPLLFKFAIIPDYTKEEKPPLFINLFKKVNSKRFIVYGVALIVMSNLVFYPIYYIVSGIVFIVFGLLAKIFGTKEVLINQDQYITKLFSEN